MKLSLQTMAEEDETIGARASRTAKVTMILLFRSARGDRSDEASISTL